MPTSEEYRNTVEAAPEIIAWNLARRSEPHDESSCKALWAAVLNQAIEDMKIDTGPTYRQAASGVDWAVRALAKMRETIRDAADWIASDDDEPGSFVWICELLGLDPNYVRSEALQRWAKAA